MPSGASASDLLAARDARQALLDRHLSVTGPAAPALVVALSLAIPGAEKVPPGAAALLAWARAGALDALAGARVLCEVEDALGPFVLLAASGDAPSVKAACVALEAARPAARLVDLDVYTAPGAALDRAALGLPPRPCLCCEAPARECIRAGRHGFPALVARALELLARG